ncbi:transposase [Pseudovibrio sp. SPO723]|uniref:transposase n=1 Tax=Nesiotobacter zosterae TaxID=392721 RepID=UPI0029C5856E|nr:transposase [Pseudovibrio sp. SPO723]MDX5594263.1 transposase [Pseudovibrio sp. SPO723]
MVATSEAFEEGIKRRAAKRKSAPVIVIMQGKTTVAEASRSYDATPSEIESWVDDVQKGIENAIPWCSLALREEAERSSGGPWVGYAVVGARKKLQASLHAEDDK